MDKFIRILITGSRNWPDEKAFEINDHLDRMILQQYSNDHPMIIQGGCPTGVDRIAKDWAHMNYVPCLTWPANWPRHGNSAGPIRNRFMIEHGDPHKAYAFFWKTTTNGTQDCVSKLLDARVPVKKFYGGLT